MTTSTEKNANTSPTAASSGTDINGAAAQNACIKIKKRLTALMVAMKDIPSDHWASKTAALGTIPEIDIGDGYLDDRVTFKDQVVTYEALGEKTFHMSFHALIREAYLSRISLCEYAHHSIPGLGFDKLKGHGQAFLYFTQGVAASEVELDRWTGEVKVRRVDLIMDLGRPINAALDLGQVTGGFIQGMGWVTTENLVYDKKGFLLSHSPSTYKIPSIQDTPRIFNVRLLENNGNTVNVHRTKAAGEPPLLLALSTWTAIRDAIMSYRGGEISPLLIPATSEQILRRLAPEDFVPYARSSQNFSPSSSAP
jgi:xanthine dehydrogenase large subunit